MPIDFSGRVESSTRTSSNPKRRVELVDRLADRVDLVGDLIGRAVDVRVVLGEGAHAQQPVQHALALVARDLPELGEPQRQLAVGVAVGVEDEAGAGAVHRPQRVAALGLVAVALGGLGEEHVLAVVVPVAGAVPQLLVEDLRRLDLDVAALVELRAHLGLDQLAAAPSRSGSQNGIPGASGAEHEQVELGPEPAVVARPRLLEALEVLVRAPSR